MMVVGLTGSIGTGKSTAAAMLAGMGLPVFDADAAVHALMAPGGEAVAPIATSFPGVTAESGGRQLIDRKALGSHVFGDTGALRRLESILHPLVRRRERQFIATARRMRLPAVVLDIPLLFETGGNRRCDSVIVVSAPRFLQRQRVMRRPGMTEERFRQVLARQTPDAEKRRRADFVVPTGLGYGDTRRRLRAIVSLLLRKEE